MAAISQIAAPDMLNGGISLSLITEICVIALFYGFSGQVSQISHSQIQNGCHFFSKWPLFCKMICKTCKMEECPFP